MELNKYIETIKDAADNAYRKIEAAMMDSDIAYEALQKKAYQLSKEGIDEQRNKINTKFISDTEAAHNGFAAILDEQKAGYMKEVSDFYTPNGSRIDLNDMNLIKSGLLLSPENIHEKIMQYADNVTMLLIFSKYVQENHVQLTGKLGAEISGVFRRVNAKGDAEKRAFNRFVNLTAAGLVHPDKAYVHIWRKLDDYKIMAEIDILKATPVIDEAVQNQVAALETELAKLEEARGFKKKPSNQPISEPQKPPYWGGTM